MARRYLESVGEMEARLNILMRRRSVLTGLSRAAGEDEDKRRAQARELAGGIEEAWKKLHRQRRLVAHSIGRLPREEERDLLSLRYLDGLSYPDIAEVLGYSQRQIFRIHQRALLHMEALTAEGESDIGLQASAVNALEGAGNIKKVPQLVKEAL